MIGARKETIGGREEMKEASGKMILEKDKMTEARGEITNG